MAFANAVKRATIAGAGGGSKNSSSITAPKQSKLGSEDKMVKHFFAKNEDKAKKVKKITDGMRRQLQARKEAKINDALKKGEPQISMKQVLADCRMSKYYPYFRDSGVDCVEHYARKSDAEVEDMIAAVEKMSNYKFPYAHRVRIFKAIRMRWFADPTRVRPYVDTDALPRLFLGKRDHRFFDQDAPYEKIESERQRMICRKLERTDDEDARRTQYEVRTRHPEFYYELRDVQRCIQEWRQFDPRRMIREDPREEQFLQRLRNLELKIAKSMAEEKLRDSRKFVYMTQLRFLRVLFTGLFIAMFVFAFSNTREQIDKINMLSSAQFMSGIWLFVASQFAYGVSTHKKPNKELQRANKMHNACKKLNAQIVTFRLDSANKRVDKYDEVMDELMEHFGINKAKKKEALTAEELAAKGFDAWFEDVMSKPYSKYDCALEMRESLHYFPRDPNIPGLPKDGLEHKAERLIQKKLGQGVKEYARAANPNSALQNAETYFNEEAHREVVQEYEEMRLALEKLVKAEQGDDSDEEGSDEESDAS